MIHMPKPISNEKMMLISVHIPKRMLEELDEIVRRGYFPSRSEAIRVAIRDLIDKYIHSRPRTTQLTSQFTIGR